MLLFRRIGAITNVPAGTSTVPPPSPAVQSSMAFCTATVSLVVPSPLAPYIFTSHTLPAAFADKTDMPNASPTTNRAPTAIFIPSPHAKTRSEKSYASGPGPRHLAESASCRATIEPLDQRKGPTDRRPFSLSSLRLGY